MDRTTRDKFAARTPQDDALAPQACWETPPAVVRAIVCTFGEFDIDRTRQTGGRLRVASFPVPTIEEQVEGFL